MSPSGPTTESSRRSGGSRSRVEPGQTLGIVGESGSGKSVSTQTIMGLTRGAEVEGEALFDGRDLLTMTSRNWREVRGAQIGMIFQDPLSSLHPFYKVGWQIVEMLQAARQRDVEGGGPQAGRRAARPGRHPAAGPAGRRLPASVLRRHAAAGDDRDGDGAQPGAADRRRADDGAGRDGAGAGAADDQPAAAGVRHRGDPDHPRPRRDRRRRRRRGGDVRRHGRWSRPTGSTAFNELPPPLHRRAAAVAAGLRRRAGAAARRSPGSRRA